MKPTMTDEKNWYYFMGGKSCGPCTKSQLVGLVISQKIERTTPVWTPSDELDWAPLESVISLKDELPPPLPNGGKIPDVVSTTLALPTFSDRDEKVGPNIHSSRVVDPKISKLVVEHSEQSKDFPHPWRRYLARILDTSVHGTIVFFVFTTCLYFVVPRAGAQFANFIGNQKSAALEFFLVVLLAPALNALFIGYTGGSLGKWIFGVKVVRSDGRSPGYLLALKRELLVWVYGMGLGVPLINLVTFAHQYSRLKKDNEMSWDRTLNLKVVYRRDGALNVLLIVVGLLLLVMLRAMATCTKGPLCYG